MSWNWVRPNLIVPTKKESIQKSYNLDQNKLTYLLVLEKYCFNNLSEIFSGRCSKIEFLLWNSAKSCKNSEEGKFQDEPNSTKITRVKVYVTFCETILDHVFKRENEIVIVNCLRLCKTHLKAIFHEIVQKYAFL